MMLPPVEDGDWMSPPYSASDIFLIVFLPILAIMLIVSGWKILRNGEMTIQGTTIGGWWPYMMGFIYLLIGTIVALVMILALIGKLA